LPFSLFDFASPLRLSLSPLSLLSSHSRY
jgi:hypothetical protein